MSYASFGPGILIITRTDLANQTPVNVGFVQEFSIDLAGETKELYGQNQYALVVARGTIKASGKWKAAEISAYAWNSVFFGQSTLSQGGFQWNVGEKHAITGGLVTVTNSASFDKDLGVIYDATRNPSFLQTAAPTVGNYEQSNGVYTFNTIENGLTVDITYSSTTTAGQSLMVTSQLIGTTPTFQLDYYTALNQPSGGSTTGFANLTFACRVFYCVADKESIGFKLTDFMMPEFDFMVGANVQGNVMEYVFSPNAS